MNQILRVNTTPRTRSLFKITLLKKAFKTRKVSWHYLSCLYIYLSSSRSRSLLEAFMEAQTLRQNVEDQHSNDNNRSPTVVQRLEALNKASQRQVPPETSDTVGSIRARWSNQQTTIQENGSKTVTSSIQEFESKNQTKVGSKGSVVNNVKKTFEQQANESPKDCTVSRRIQELSAKKQVEQSQVRQLASQLETRQKTQTEKPAHSSNLSKLKKKFEATSNRANSLSRSLNSPNNKFPNKGGYVLETSKLFGGATVFKFSGVSKSSDGVEKNSSDESTSGSNVQSKVMFYIKFQEERKDETFSPKTGSATAQDNTGQRFPSVAELRALFGTAGVPNLQKLSKKKNRQADNSNTNNNNNMEESDLDSKKNNEENEEEGDVMLEQALCRRILGKEVRRALKSLLAQQRMDALKCHPTEKDIEGREVKPLIDDFQQRKMDDSEHVGVFTNRMRKGRISVPPETTENAENSCSDQATTEMEESNAAQPEVLDVDKEENEFTQDFDELEEEKNNDDGSECNEEDSGYGAYEIVIDPDFVRRRIEQLQSGDNDESDSDDDDDDDDEPILIKTRSGRIVVDTSQYQKMSVRMAMRIAF